MPLSPAPERSARDLAATLAAQAVIAGLTFAIVAVALPEGPLSVGMLASGAIVTLVLSSAAAWLEWNKEDYAEGFALAASLCGFALSLAVGLSGLWFVAPAQAIVAFLAGFALAERLIVKGEARESARRA